MVQVLVGIVHLEKSPISDLSVLSDHEEITCIKLIDVTVNDISFIETYQNLTSLTLIGCPIEDYTPLLRITSLNHLEVDAKAIEAIGMENLINHHPDAVIEVQQKIDNRKI